MFEEATLQRRLQAHSRRCERTSKGQLDNIEGQVKGLFLRRAWDSNPQVLSDNGFQVCGRAS